jgi:hypothetical protein
MERNSGTYRMPSMNGTFRFLGYAFQYIPVKDKFPEEIMPATEIDETAYQGLFRGLHNFG